jgi:hypothetical protein
MGNSTERGHMSIKEFLEHGGMVGMFPRDLTEAPVGVIEVNLILEHAPGPPDGLSPAQCIRTAVAREIVNAMTARFEGIPSHTVCALVHSRIVFGMADTFKDADVEAALGDVLIDLGLMAPETRAPLFRVWADKADYNPPSFRFRSLRNLGHYLWGRFRRGEDAPIVEVVNPRPLAYVSNNLRVGLRPVRGVWRIQVIRHEDAGSGWNGGSEPFYELRQRTSGNFGLVCRKVTETAKSGE